MSEPIDDAARRARRTYDAAADTFDACTSERPYQTAMTAETALEILLRLRGTQIDPRVHDAALRVVKRRATAAGVAPSAATA